MIGYVGLPPWLSYPRLIETFSRAHPELQISLEGALLPVDPRRRLARRGRRDDHHAADARLGRLGAPAASVPPRCCWSAREHRLAEHERGHRGEVLDERFIAFEPWVDPAWAAFWSLDASRGGPPPGTARAARPMSGDAPYGRRRGRRDDLAGRGGQLISVAVPGVFAVPLLDAEPAVHSIVGHEDQFVTAVERLVDAGREIAGGVGSELPTG